MTGTRLADLARRREALVTRIAIERALVVRRSDALALPIRMVERGIDGVVWIRRHPLATGAALTLLFMLRGRRVLGWARRGFVLWRAGRGLISIFAGR